MPARRSQSFGAVAEAYDRYRLGYPDRMVAEILDYAGGPVGDALEIGAGTGKATRVLARHGLAVTALEPDAAMIAELRAHTPTTVAVVDSTLEDYSGTSRFGLVFAAAALHWTDAATRWERVADLLRPGGTFASVGGPMRFADPHLEQQVRAARASVLPDDDVPSPDGTPPGSEMQWPGTELEKSELFTDIRQIGIDRRLSVARDDVVGYLSTVSAYLMLDDADRLGVLDRIRNVLPDRVDVVADLVLHLARLA